MRVLELLVAGAHALGSSAIHVAAEMQHAPLIRVRSQQIGALSSLEQTALHHIDRQSASYKCSRQITLTS
jgi:hypothetical protein